DRSVKIVTDRGAVTIHLTTPEDAGAALVWHTGSPAHVEALQQRATWRVLQCRDAQLTETTGRPVRCPSEDDLYDRLDLAFLPPELRMGHGALADGERQTHS